MDAELRERIVEVLQRAHKAFEELDSNELINLSDMTIHFASIEQDPNSTTIAVLAYCLAKIAERRKLREARDWKRFFKATLEDLHNAKVALEYDDENSYQASVKHSLKFCGKLDKKFSKHIVEVIESAKIKKGSDVYRQGVSLGKAAELMGITPWELRDYVGHTRIADVDPLKTKTAKRRLKEARRLFGLE